MCNCINKSAFKEDFSKSKVIVTDEMLLKCETWQGLNILLRLKDAKMEEKDGKTLEKSPFQEEKEGLKRHKAWIDEKYRDLEEILKPESAILEKKDRKNEN